ncbi:beta family protein [Xanthobacter versatilis]|uniref:beta family protein n=1 Tax=Xanthobacter autotrophicus (strain ATCC BAA-1158 / Py2) TaxID=78245 RepID=UPI0037269E7F
MYRPLLRWKRGEQTALTNLVSGHKDATKPLLNIMPHAFNPPPGGDADGAFDQRIVQDADRLNSAWAGYEAAVDLGDIDPDARCAGGVHPVRRFFDQIASGTPSANARPVLRLTSDDDYLAAAASVCADYGVNPVFRLTPDDLAEINVADTLAAMLGECSMEPTDCDFVVDMGYISSTGRSIITARGALAAVPFSSDWASLVLVAGSFPENLAGYAVGTHIVERHEWSVWLANRSVAGRVVTYGDYATIHPLPVEEGLDPRTMNPTASVRYTFEDTWILLRGQGTRTRGSQGFSQFYGHADTIVNMPQYRGAAFSFGDTKIMRIHQRVENQGNLETWITIGVNHHIAELVGQLSILPSP